MLVALVPKGPLGPLDAAAEAWLDRSALTAAGAYAMVRLLNASVSVVKESSLELEPAGVGVSLAVGQVLDPLDDMTERLANVLVFVLAAVAAHEVLHRFAADVAPFALAALLLFAALLELLPEGKVARGPLGRTTRSIAVLVLAARVAAPLAAVSGSWAHERYFATPIAEAKANLSQGLSGVEAATEFEVAEEEGLLGAVRGATRAMRDRLDTLRASMARLVSRADQLITSLVTLTGAFLSSLLLQGLVLPLLTFLTLTAFGRATLRALTDP